jgi:serine/threonine protein kinase
MNERSPAEDIFFAALEKASPAERAAYLDGACAGNDALRRRVEALLAAHPQVGRFLERPVAEAEGLTEICGAANAPANLSFLAPPTEPGSLGRLDHYEVLEVVGKGGMGVVLRARDTKLLRAVAIKALAGPLAASGTARRRFAREARAAAAVRDDHVVAIHAVHDDGPVPYLVMEFIDGRNLDALIRRGGPLEVQEVLRIGTQVAGGLAAAHKQGLVHRDIKPANILLENGVQRVKLTDFGLARAADDVSLTQSGIVAGTPLYMSPEQAAGEPLDCRADLFSLGSVLYELCTGRPAFRAPNSVAVMKRVCEDTPRPIREVNPDIPDWLAAIITKLHAKSPAARYQSAAEVADLLSRGLAQVQQAGMGPPGPRVPSSGASGPPGKAASPARRRAAYAGLTVALVVGTLAAFWFFSRPAETRAPDGTKGAAPAAQRWKPRPVPEPGELARRSAPADALRREDIPAELLEMAGGGDKDKAPPQLVAVFGEDRHAGGDRRNHVNAVAVSPDGKTLAFGGTDKVVRRIDLTTGKPQRELTWNQRPLDGDVYTLAFSPDGKVLACGTVDGGSIVLWDATTGTQVLAMANPDGRVRQIAFSPDGTLLASAGEDRGVGVVRLWKVNGDLQFTSHTPGVWSAWSVAFSPDGKTLAAGLESGEVWLWDVAGGGQATTLTGFGGRVRWLGFNPGGQSLVVAGGFPEHVVSVYDLATRTPRQRLSGHGSGVLSGAWRADGRLLITAGVTDGTVRLWDLSSDPPRSRALPVIPPDVRWLHGIALSPEGRHLAVCNPNGTVYVLRLAGRGEVLEVPADGGNSSGSP